MIGHSERTRLSARLGRTAGLVRVDGQPLHRWRLLRTVVVQVGDQYVTSWVDQPHPRHNNLNLESVEDDELRIYLTPD